MKLLARSLSIKSGCRRHTLGLWTQTLKWYLALRNDEKNTVKTLNIIFVNSWQNIRFDFLGNIDLKDFIKWKTFLYNERFQLNRHEVELCISYLVFRWFKFKTVGRFLLAPIPAPNDIIIRIQVIRAASLTYFKIRNCQEKFLSFKTKKDLSVSPPMISWTLNSYPEKNKSKIFEQPQIPENKFGKSNKWELF